MLHGYIPTKNFYAIGNEGVGILQFQQIFTDNKCFS